MKSKLKGKAIDYELMNRRKVFLNLSDEEIQVANIENEIEEVEKE